MSRSLTRLIVVAVVLATLGALLLVAFRAYVTDELHWALMLVALAIGTGLGMVADHRARRWPNVLVAATTAWICGLAGFSIIALLERNATAAEFRISDLSRPEFFIALEAYEISESEHPTGRAFTGATRRGDYDEETWRAATDSWNAKPESEKQAVKRDWRHDYEQLNESLSSRLAVVFLAPAYLLTYAIGAVTAAAIMFAFSLENLS